MTPGDRERVQALVKRTCAEQGIPLIVPPEVAAAIARLLASAGIERGGEAVA